MAGGNGGGGGHGRGRGGVAVGRPDRRPQSEKAVISWNGAWMAEKDILGDSVGEWAEKVDFNTGKCIWCQKCFKFNSLGKHIFLCHARGEFHTQIADGRKGRLVGQPTLLPPPVVKFNDIGGVGPGQGGEAQAGGVGGRQARAQVVPAGTLGASGAGSLNDRVLRAEIRWSLKVVSSGYSYKSCNDIVEIFKLIDPDSDVFKKMTLKENKVSYTVSHGLFPYFLKKTIDAIRKSPGVSLCTDGSTFKQKGLSTQIDIGVRYECQNQAMKNRWIKI